MTPSSLRSEAVIFSDAAATSTCPWSFQRIAEQHHGSSLQWFFDQWLCRAGHPIYSTAIYYKTQGDSNSAWVKLRQTSTTGELYKMPLALACSTSAGFDSMAVVWDSLASQDFLVYDDQPIARVKLDPDSWVLKEVYDSLPVLSSLTTTMKSDKYGKGPVFAYWHKYRIDSTCAGYKVYRADNAAGPFARINSDIIPDTMCTDLTANGGTEYYYTVTAVSSTDTCYETRQSNVLSIVAGGVEGNPGDSEPIEDIGLTQNAPNPFKQSTVIKYQLTRPGLATIKVYNIQGQLVKTLINGSQPAGRHQAQWNGRDEGGRIISSGIYFARLEAEGRTITRTLQYIK